MTKKQLSILNLILILGHLSKLYSQCIVDAGIDTNVCGNSLQLYATANAGDYNMFWTSLQANIEFDDANNPNSTVSYTGDFSNNPSYEAQLVWTTTNSSDQTCSDTIQVTFKVIPSSEFVIESATCSGTYTGIYCINNPNYIPPPGITDWVYELPVEVIDGTSPYDFLITAINTDLVPKHYSISLQRTYNNCTSEISNDSLLVFPWSHISCCIDPIAYAGEDTTICDTIYQLQATLSDNANLGYWVQVSGPIAAFINEDQGSPSESGNPNATIIIQSPGIACLV